MDAAEEPENIAKVRAVNVDGTRFIAEVCKKLGAKMLYISTDYVFNGKGTTPWDPDCKEYDPLNVYGQSKLDGEFTVSSLLDKYFIVRIAWVFGLNGNFRWAGAFWSRIPTATSSKSATRFRRTAGCTSAA